MWNPDGPDKRDLILGYGPDAGGYDKFISDNLKIWNYAKTDFSDRFVEAGGPPEMPIFADGFETGDFSQWNNYSSGGGDLSVRAAAASVGGKGLQAIINDNTPIGVRDEQPAGERHYRARFYFDPNSLAMDNGDWHVLFFGYSGSDTTRPVLRIDLLFRDDRYHVRAVFLNDNTTWRTGGAFVISNSVHYLEVEWQASDGPGANNGLLNFWIDGVRRSSLTGMDNDTRRIDLVRLGPVAGIDVGTRGTDFFDAFESRRASYIGPAVGGPLVMAAADTSERSTWTEMDETTDPAEAELIREVRQAAQSLAPEEGVNEEPVHGVYLPYLRQ
jgi:hypothetical protein